MSDATRHPDLLTREEAALLLGVSKSTMAHGFGPPPLPGYRRKRFYSKQHCEQWLEDQKERAWASTNDAITTKSNGLGVSTSGGSASVSTATRGAVRQTRQIAERLRLKSGVSAASSSPRALVAVPEEA